MDSWFEQVAGCGLACARMTEGFVVSPTTSALERLDTAPLLIPLSDASVLAGRTLWVADINAPDTPLLSGAKLRDARTVSDVLQVDAQGTDTSATELADWIAAQKADADEEMWDEALRNVAQQEVWWRVLQRGFRVDTDMLEDRQAQVRSDRSRSHERVGVDLFDNRAALRFLEDRGIIAHLGDKTVAPVTHKLWHLAEVPPEFAEDWTDFCDIRARARTVLKVQEIDREGGRRGRVNSKWQVSGAKRTGRMSSSRVQMQNIPAELRPMFRAERGHVLIQCDLNRAEPTVAAWLSGDQALADALAAGDLYEEIATTVGSISRSDAKVTLLALLYGEGDAALGRSLGRSRQQARTVREEVLDAYPDLAQWRKRTARKARRDRYVKNGFGRILHVPAGEDYKAVNYVCQSTSAAILFDMLNRIIEHPLLGQDMLWLAIHDEVLLQVPEADDYEDVLCAMQECMTTKLPGGITVSGEPQVIGNRWLK